MMDGSWSCAACLKHNLEKTAGVMFCNGLACACFEDLVGLGGLFGVKLRVIDTRL